MFGIKTSMAFHCRIVFFVLKMAKTGALEIRKYAIVLSHSKNLTIFEHPV